MGFGIFFGNPQIKSTGLENKSFFGYFEIGNGIMLFGIQLGIYIGSQPFAQMHIITVTS